MRKALLALVLLALWAQSAWAADATLSNFGAASAAAGADLIPTSQSGTPSTTLKQTLTAVSVWLWTVINGDCTANSSGAFTCNKTGGVAFAASATTDTTVATNISSGTLPAGRMPALTGDVTTSVGAVATTLATNIVTNAKAAQMAAHTIKGNNTGSTANAIDLTDAQVAAELPAVVGDSGSGGTKGLVPAPASGDAAAGKFLKADGTFAVPAGGGSGTVTSIGLADATNGGITITGATPITTSGSWTAAVNVNDLTSKTTPVATDLVAIYDVAGTATKQATAAKIQIAGSGGGTSNFLRADGTWAAPGGSGTVTVVGAGTLTSNAMVTGGGSQTLQTDNSITATAGALSLGSTGVAGSVAFGNATSGTVTLQPVSGALGAVTASLPANTGTIAELNLAQTWTAAQSFNSGDVKLNGATSGAITLNAAATAGSNTITLPAGTTDFSATGGASQVVKQTSAGGALTVATENFTDLAGTISVAQIAGSGASHAVPVDVAGTPTWKVVPDCTDTGGNHINYTQSTDAFSCGTSGGASVSVTAGTPNVVITPSPGTGTFTVGTTAPFNAQTGTSYTVVTGDNAKLITSSNASAIAFTLPQAGSGGFASGWSAGVADIGAGANTITTTTSKILGGGQTLFVPKGTATLLASDGTDWQGILGVPPYPNTGALLDGKGIFEANAVLSGTSGSTLTLGSASVAGAIVLNDGSGGSGQWTEGVNVLTGNQNVSIPYGDSYGWGSNNSVNLTVAGTGANYGGISFVSGTDFARNRAAESYLWKFGATTFTLTGNYALDRGLQVLQNTYTAGSAQTLTEADNAAVAGAPIAAGSATITTSVGLHVQAGSSLTGGVTTGIGLLVDPPTGAGTNLAAKFTGPTQFNVGGSTIATGAFLGAMSAASAMSNFGGL